MKNSIKLLGALLLGSIASTAFSAPIVGEIGIALLGENTISIDYDANAVSFTGNPNSVVNKGTGSYSPFAPAPLPTTVAQYANFNYTQPFAPVDQVIWSIDTAGLDAWFKLSSITNVTETANGLVLIGVGTAWMTGFDATLGKWSFSANRATQTAAFNFSSTNISPLSVPDGGTTALLLGVGLVGMSFLARRKSV